MNRNILGAAFLGASLLFTNCSKSHKTDTETVMVDAGPNKEENKNIDAGEDPEIKKIRETCMLKMQAVSEFLILVNEEKVISPPRDRKSCFSPPRHELARRVGEAIVACPTPYGITQKQNEAYRDLLRVLLKNEEGRPCFSPEEIRYYRKLIKGEKP
jgi:hypothetical protein